jgi:hypothetical protein
LALIPSTSALTLQLKPFDPTEQNLALPIVAGERRRSTELRFRLGGSTG